MKDESEAAGEVPSRARNTEVTRDRPSTRARIRYLTAKRPPRGKKRVEGLGALFF